MSLEEEVIRIQEGLKALEKELHAAEAECIKRDAAQAEDIKELKEYKIKTEKYGVFLMGMFALGAMLFAGLEKAVQKLMGLLP